MHELSNNFENTIYTIGTFISIVKFEIKSYNTKLLNSVKICMWHGINRFIYML